MKTVIQRVDKASITVNDSVVATIGCGLLIFVGIHKDDTEKDRDFILRKLLKLRLFPDETKNINKSIEDVGGELLLVSQFTLYADCTKGNRPSFIHAMPPEQAQCFYEDFVQEAKRRYLRVQSGIFGAMMKISSINSGPVTIILDSKDRL